MRICLQLLTLALCGTVASIAVAHEGGHGHSSGSASVRTWTLAASGAHFHGSFVTANETKATFEREDGRVISIDRAELIPQDQDWIVERLVEIKRVNELRNVQLVAQRGPAKPGDSKTREGKPAPDAKSAPEIHLHFLPFKESLGLRWDERFYYVESNGMPDHPMMTGITAWQQQVPLPQSYNGDNAWQIPLFPVRAERPMSGKTNFFRGAIALAVNGVPIFNPIKNDGKTDTFIAGELDQWGGHCGRADDYHYHLPPVHLEKTVGEHKPIAYALDGYPIYGYQEKTDPDYAPLDWLNGHTDSDGSYHYHSTKTYPYLNGGFYGVVTERDGQVDPQPRAKPVRPSLTPLRGAKITGFDRSDDNKKFRIEIDVSGKEQSVEYALTGDSVQFTFNEGRSKPRTETYRLSNQGNRPAPGGQQRRGGKAGKQPQPRGDKDRQQSEATQPRRPWIEVHASEMDTNQDDMLTRDEVQTEARKAFSAYDSNDKGALLLSDLAAARPVRSAMGGFIREHAKELDKDNDGKLTAMEILSNAERMFDKADADRDGRITITDEQKPTEQPKIKPKESPAPNRPVSSSKARSTTATSRTHPNVIFILIDDMGWRDVGFAGNDFVETPNIDRLADEGVRFTQAYASAPNCAPTRACLMSGQYTPRHGVYTVIDPRHEPGQPHHRILSAPSKESLSGDCITIAELLQQHGYATACFGMWNLGRGRNGPTTALGQGFDHYEKLKRFWIR